MAYILQKEKDRPIYVKAYHSIGSLKSAVETFISHPTVSRTHAIVHWKSKNGTAVNNQKIPTNSDIPIKKGDKLTLANNQELLFTLVDDSPPCDMPIPLEEPSQSMSSNFPDAVYLSGYHLLPNEVAPQAILYKLPTNTWRIEYTNGPTKALDVNDGDWVYFDNRRWMLQCSLQGTDTLELTTSTRPIQDVLFRFNLSLDEEATQLELKTSQQTYDFQVRSHHYLTLNLARHKAADAQNGIDKAGQGWVYTELLAKELGTEISYLNIMIHRARKQFSDMLQQQYLCDHLIERQAGKLRFGGLHFEIYKGSELEHAVCC
jgi:pSer/pThr/pTyr-binding forkhead associated (FHA) protein